MNKKILIVEDDDSIVYVLETLLQSNGYDTIVANTGKEALLEVHKVDLILLDLGLPDMEGEDVLKKIRGIYQKPVLVLSARSKEDQKVKAFENGADDYITKPFGNSELLARIQTAFRHYKVLPENKEYQYKDLKILLEDHRVLLNGEEIHFTVNEFKIISLLVQNSGKLLTYDYLMEHVWGPYSLGDNKILRVNMANIRRKIEKNAAEPEYITTEIGVGYRIKENENE